MGVAVGAVVSLLVVGVVYVKTETVKAIDYDCYLDSPGLLFVVMVNRGLSQQPF
jgi:hypothetical protein